MLLKTKIFQDTCKIIGLAVDNSAADLELFTDNNILYLNVTNKEYFVSIKYELATKEAFHATVNAALFLNLISGITTEEFEISLKNNTVIVRAGKSTYKLAIIYENDTVMTLPRITLNNVSIEMLISADILHSIVNINSKELLKLKNADANELQKLYYIDESGCFTFTSGACLNKFSLEKPIRLLLSDRIIKLFKLFNTDVDFKFGHDDNSGMLQTKIVLKTDNIYLSAIVINDDLLFNKVQAPCNATKNYIAENYDNRLVLSVDTLSAAISRLMLFTKNNGEKVNISYVPIICKLTNEEFIISDKLENTEYVHYENNSISNNKDYVFSVNINDIKLVLDSCKGGYITLNFGNHKSIIINRGNIYNLIPEIIM